MSTRRCCDVTSLELAHLYPWFDSGVLFRLNSILTENNISLSLNIIQGFYVLPLCYVIKLKGFSPKDRPKLRHFFQALSNLK